MSFHYTANRERNLVEGWGVWVWGLHNPDHPGQHFDEGAEFSLADASPQAHENERMGMVPRGIYNM